MYMFFCFTYKFPKLTNNATKMNLKQTTQTGKDREESALVMEEYALKQGDDGIETQLEKRLNEKPGKDYWDFEQCNDEDDDGDAAAADGDDGGGGGGSAAVPA